MSVAIEGPVSWYQSLAGSSITHGISPWLGQVLLTLSDMSVAIEGPVSWYQSLAGQVLLTSSDMSVAIERPISWYRSLCPWGPSSMNRKRVGIGTSVKSPRCADFLRRMKAISGCSRKSTSPTMMLEASAPGGSFLKKCSLNCRDNKITEYDGYDGEDIADYMD